jgi:hypothetical protein
MRIDEVQLFDTPSELQITLHPLRGEGYFAFAVILALVLAIVAIPLGIVAILKTFGTSAMLVPAAWLSIATLFLFGLVTEILWAVCGKESWAFERTGGRFERTLGRLLTISKMRFQAEDLSRATVVEREMARRGYRFKIRQIEISVGKKRITSWGRLSEIDGGNVGILLREKLRTLGYF